MSGHSHDATPWSPWYPDLTAAVDAIVLVVCSVGGRQVSTAPAEALHCRSTMTSDETDSVLNPEVTTILRQAVQGGA